MRKEANLNWGPFNNILIAEKDGVLILTLNRPQRLNALSSELMAEVDRLLDGTAQSPDVKVLIITGAPRADGRPCFSSGADIKEMKELGTTIEAVKLGTPEEALVRTAQAFTEQKDAKMDIFIKLMSYPKPTIAAIDGVCTAGGLELALCCDMRIVAETAVISDLHLKNLGVLGGGGLQTWLPRAVGITKAKEIIWTAEPIDGKEAFRIGLASKAVPQNKLLEEAETLARKIAQMPLTGLRMSKMVLNASLTQGVAENLRFSAMIEAIMHYIGEEKLKSSFEKFTDRS